MKNIVLKKQNQADISGQKSPKKMLSWRNKNQVKVKWHLIFPFDILEIVSPDPKTVLDIKAKSNLAIPHIGFT